MLPRCSRQRARLIVATASRPASAAVSSVTWIHSFTTLLSCFPIGVSWAGIAAAAWSRRPWSTFAMTSCARSIHARLSDSNWV